MSTLLVAKNIMLLSDLPLKEEAIQTAKEAAETKLKNMTATMERQHAEDMEKLSKHIKNQEKEVDFIRRQFICFLCFEISYYLYLFMNSILNFLFYLNSTDILYKANFKLNLVQFLSNFILNFNFVFENSKIKYHFDVFLTIKL